MIAEASDHTWAVAPDVAWELTTDGRAVVMALEAGSPLLLSPSGSAIWEVLVDGRTPEEDLTTHLPEAVAELEVAARVAQAFGLGAEDVAADVHTFVEMLESHRILVRPGAS